MNRDVRDHMGRVFVDPDFFLFRPLYGYRTNANITLLRTDPAVIIDTGTKLNPPIAFVEHTLQKYGLSPDRIKYIILTHDHQDHFQNLQELQRLAPHAHTLCHQGDIRTLRFPFLMSKSWYEGLMYYGMKKWGTYAYNAFYAVFSNVFFKTLQRPNRLDAYLTEEKKLLLGSDWIRLFSLRGHSQGHLCVLDSRKNLYLGDFVPYTPWVEPTSHGIDYMLGSLKQVLKFTSNEVHRSVRAHGDIRRPNPKYWELSPWVEEKARFQEFHDTILTTLDKIPSVIRGKEVTIHELTSIFAPKYQRYSTLMRIVFIPPAITWGIAYALKLKSQGKIQVVKKNNRYYWTA